MCSTRLTYTQSGWVYVHTSGLPYYTDILTRFSMCKPRKRIIYINCSFLHETNYSVKPGELGSKTGFSMFPTTTTKTKTTTTTKTSWWPKVLVGKFCIYTIIQICHASGGNMMECFPEGGWFSRGRSPRENHPPEGKHSIMLPPLAWHICFIIPNKPHL